MPITFPASPSNGEIFTSGTRTWTWNSTYAAWVGGANTITVSGTNTGDNAVNSLYSGLVTNATHSGDATGDTVLTLATVNAGVGSFGSATAAPAITVNAKGLVTAAASNTITPAVGSITGLGTGIATALAVNTGSAGAPVLFDGALGTPSSGTLTNATGLPTAGIVDAAVTLAKMADLAQDQFIGRTTASTGVPQTTTITAAARTVLDDATVAAMVDTLGGATSTGTGGIARATSPTFVTPILGTPTSGTVTNLTGTASININGTVGATTPGTGAFTTLTTTGKVGLAGGAIATTTKARIGGNHTGGTSLFGVSVDGAIQSDVTSAYSAYRTFTTTQATAFTMQQIFHFRAQQGTFGVDSIVNYQYGFAAEASLTGGLNNYGFYSDLAAATGRWNFRANGTAQNWFAGRVGIGTGKSIPAYDLEVAGQARFGGGIVPRIVSITSNATWAINADTTDQYNVTAQAVAVTTISNPSGTPADGQKLTIRATCDGTNRALTWSGSQWRAVGVTLPTTLVASKVTIVGAIWNVGSTTWDVVAVSQQA